MSNGTGGASKVSQGVIALNNGSGSLDNDSMGGGKTTLLKLVSLVSLPGWVRAKKVKARKAKRYLLEEKCHEMLRGQKVKLMRF